MPFKYASPVDRLIANSVLSDNGCWEWTAAYNNVGRPVLCVRIKGKVKKITVARYVVQFVHLQKWREQNFKINQGAHNCFNKRCARPDHIRKKTAKQNMRDVDRRVVA